MGPTITVRTKDDPSNVVSPKDYLAAIEDIKTVVVIIIITTV